MKWEPHEIELLCNAIDINEFEERLEQVAEILYEYVCQFEKVNPTEDLDSSSLSNINERTA
jgi:SHS2 domain-containing protein